MAIAVLLAAASPLPALGDDRSPPVREADRGAVTERITELFAIQNDASTYPLPLPEGDRLEELLDGKIVRFREKWVLSSGVDENGEEEQRERHRVMAFYLVPKPMEQVWVASIDPHFLGNDRLSEARLESSGTIDLWYQLLDPPWPVKNRHWVIRVEKPLAVHEASGGDVWEQVWSLADDGERIAMEVTAAGRVPEVPLERAKKSRYLEENVGAWTIFRVDDDLALAAYQLTIVMGGWVPDRLTARFAMGALEELMKTVEKAASEIDTHYDPTHEPIWGGHGRPIAPFSAEERPEGQSTNGDDDGEKAEH